ncbi:uncharacterized protein I206_107090 [Kwoniella pini CBS 10737]|uniref:SMP-30/Gluconolactonase/LRE-like region domain-containing protein n=1 Tax=Kwoniella pini CBS 10737 TaxID=1296096 RepID=A0A1B9HZ67_9TREE|nr:uncharacterized protein I206_05366 [Kwoniella pini CBS 10737]OCF48587.1 hypothetical protein I206_05366 [Kwoniella pini CBS 10737]
MSLHNVPIFDAEVLLECQNNLGEGILWDSKTQLLHWVDIFNSQLHSYDPKEKTYSIDKYLNSKCLTYITPKLNDENFLGTFEGNLIELPKPTKPFEFIENSNSNLINKKIKINQKNYLKIISEPLNKELVLNETIRFNDGGVDPIGRVFFGSMGQNEKVPKFPGELWQIDLDGKETKILDEVGVSNGLGFSSDGKKMYYIDSRKDQIDIFDYDLLTGKPTNRRKFASSPPPLDKENPTEGVYDGLCLDGIGNIWVARWRNGRVIGFNSNGDIIAMITVKGSKGATIPCFGGPNLETMYIATASSYLGGEGDSEKYPNSGDLYSIGFGPDSPIRKVLGDNWKGAERYRAGI